MLTYECSEFKLLVMHELDSFDVVQQNIDFNITVDNIKYAGTAVTLKNIEYLMKKFRATGDSHFGCYFWQSNMLILEEMSIDCLRDALLDIVKDKTSGTLDDMFYRINCDS
ncbi:hypothetical protein I5515_12245 [Acinetobacter calcoaceticus]|uniref:hypothetical protein n=1 Tax=Acinetobacter calcoaceticus TaxID=471 RepID=UPI001901AAC7|nr:hypothetical protein [Acinetobacter calcoaceticus]MBJ9722572.1 hypothetical protein [Acinetobacter calcoaceticus]